MMLSSQIRDLSEPPNDFTEVALENASEVQHLLAQPSRTSVGAALLRECGDEQILHDVRDYATHRVIQLSEVATQASIAPMRLARAPSAVFPMWSAARSAIEAAGLVAWLFTPKFVEAVIQRSLGLRIHDWDDELQALSKYRRELAGDPRLPGIEARVGEIRLLKRNNFDFFGSVDLVPKTPPRLSDLASEIGLGSDYAISTGVSHGSPVMLSFLMETAAESRIGWLTTVSRAHETAATAQVVLVWAVGSHTLSVTGQRALRARLNKRLERVGISARLPGLLIPGRRLQSKKWR